jgi:hypothetical protein
MDDDFDISAAVDDIGSGLGFDAPEESDDVKLNVTLPAGETMAAGAEDPQAAAGTPEQKPAATVTPPADEAPRTWRKEASAVWAGLPSEAKAEILKREADIFQGIESYKVDANFGKSIKSIVTPYEQILRENQMDPAQTIQSLMAAHHTFATGASQAKTELFLKMARDYRIDLSQLGVEAPYVDPTVANLQSQLEQVQSRLQAADRAAHAEKLTSLSKQVESFASDPKNVHFNDVATEIEALLRADRTLTLEAAYDKAVWLNPATRAKEIARTTAEASAKAAAEAKAKSDAARKATAANVTTRAKSGSAAASLSSLDDTLSATLANIKLRG